MDRWNPCVATTQAWVAVTDAKIVVDKFDVLRVINATAEGLNRKIRMVKEMACGFRNREHYKTAIYFHCGGLDLYPDWKHQHERETDHSIWWSPTQNPEAR